VKAFLGVLLAAIAVYALAVSAIGAGQPPVRFVDITDAAGIRFRHTSAPEKKYLVESMSGGVALFDYDRDGCLDIYFTNALTVDTANQPASSRSALYHNNCDGTYTDVTDRAGVGYPGWAMGVLAADFDGNGWEDLYPQGGRGRSPLVHGRGAGRLR
jgi:hypothetical protein